MKKLRIHYFQHVPYEGLGCIADWALQNDHSLTATKFYEAQDLPDLNEIDWLIIMGGPMGVYDEDLYQWLKLEKAFIRKAIEANKIVIGICLGAQLIATVTGAKVFANDEKEIGWFPVALTANGKQHELFKGLPGTFSVLHWHGDTFALPENAEHLLESIACINQAYSFETNVLALQFHLEATPATLNEMIENGMQELKPARYVQTADEILKEGDETKKTNDILHQILDRLAKA